MENEKHLIARFSSPCIKEKDKEVFLDENGTLYLRREEVEGLKAISVNRFVKLTKELHFHFNTDFFAISKSFNSKFVKLIGWSDDEEIIEIVNKEPSEMKWDFPIFVVSYFNEFFKIIDEDVEYDSNQDCDLITNGICIGGEGKKYRYDRSYYDDDKPIVRQQSPTIYGFEEIKGDDEKK